MRRYYLSPIRIYNEPGLGDFYSHHFAQAYPGVEYQGGEIAPPDAEGNREKALLILVPGIDHTAYANDPDLVALPDVDLDLKVASIKSSTKIAAQTKAKAACGYTDLEIIAVWGNADGMRDVINTYGRANNPSFDANNFDLTDL